MFFNYDYNKSERKELDSRPETPEPTAAELISTLNLVRNCLKINTSMKDIYIEI